MMPDVLRKPASKVPPVQSAVYRWLWYHPEASEKDCAEALHLSYSSVRVAISKIRKRDTAHLCPICFKESLYNLVCHNCGADFTSEAHDHVSPDYSSQSPVHSIQPNGGMGTLTPYGELKLKNRPYYIRHIVEEGKDRFIEKAKSVLWEELKGYSLPDDEVEEATRMLVKEIQEFRASYPGLVRSKGLTDELVNRVLARIRLLHPDVKLLTKGDDLQ